MSLLTNLSPIVLTRRFVRIFARHILHPLAAFYATCQAESAAAGYHDLLRLSDAELAERGLSRPEAVDRHYGDLFYA